MSEYTRDPSVTMSPDHLAELLRNQAVMVDHIDLVGDKAIITPDVPLAQRAAVIATIGSYVFDPDWNLPQIERDWRAKLLSEIAFLTDQLAILPATLSNSQRDSAIKRLIRNQIRILKFIHNNTMDVG